MVYKSEFWPCNYWFLQWFFKSKCDKLKQKESYNKRKVNNDQDEYNEYDGGSRRRKRLTRRRKNSCQRKTRRRKY